MTNQRLLLLAAAAFPFLLPASLGAQESNTFSTWTNLNSLASGAEVRVTLAGGKEVRGFIQRVTADSLSLNTADSQETLARPQVRRVSAKRPGHRGRNTLIGLGIGAGAGLATGAGIDSQRNSGDWFPNVGKAVFAPLGAIIGTVVGAAWPTGGWKDIYRAP
ncbi:MAG: hypothetical protein QM757_12095 [Paludibaculum sp.]